MSASIKSKGLANNYFVAHYFHGYNKHIFSPQELYNVSLALTAPQKLYKYRLYHEVEVSTGFIHPRAEGSEVCKSCEDRHRVV